jgi:hypothetical protein
MSEFKFACPVCGQHITADSKASGGQLECPTCFQKIVIPQAPTQGDPKLILSAAQAGKPRPVPSGVAWTAEGQLPRRSSFVGPAAFLLVLCAGIAAAYVFRQPLSDWVRHGTADTNLANGRGRSGPGVSYPVPTNINWSLNLANSTFPDMIAAGSIHSSGFFCERATIQGGVLTLRQGRGWPPDLGLTVHLVAKQGEDLSGKTAEVTPDRVAPAPRVVLRWKEPNGHPDSETVTGGYALKLAFGQAANGWILGRIYICLPDASHSFVAGTFSAEIRHPPPAANSAGTSPN